MDLPSKTLVNLSRYKIYNNGWIYDCKRNVFLPYQLSSDGYCKITLSLDCGKRKTFSVHRLVAIAFVENPQDKKTVNHIDGSKVNNHRENLEWSTHSEQIQHAWDNGLIKNMEARKLGVRKKQGKPVICLTTGEIFDSIGHAAEVKKIQKTNISGCCKQLKNFKTAGKLDDGTKLEWRFYELQTNG